MSYIVCASIKTGEGSFHDVYQVFLEEDYDHDPLLEATEFYEEMLATEEVYTVNLCEILKSSDYGRDQQRKNKPTYEEGSDL